MHSAEEGAYLLQRIQARCTDDAGCMVWQGYSLRGRMPIINIDGVPTAVRRTVFQLTFGAVAKDHEVVGTCETPLCVSAEHLEQITMAERRRRMGVARRRQLQKLVILMRDRYGKLDMEKARAIRASDEEGKVLAERYGVSGTLIGYVRSGKSWAEPSPFAGLGAR